MKGRLVKVNLWCDRCMEVRESSSHTLMEWGVDIYIGDHSLVEFCGQLFIASGFSKKFFLFLFERIEGFASTILWSICLVGKEQICA